MISVAAVQEPSIYMDKEGCLNRAVEIIKQAANENIELLVFPEGWVPGYPLFVWGMIPTNDPGELDQLYRRLFSNSIDLSKDQLAPVREAAREYGIVVVMCVNERAGELSSGTIYNTAVTIDATGEILNVHRKVMPTNAERTVWGFGDGRGLNVVDTAVGRVGVLLCWENFMPLARQAIYAQNVEIYCAPTADDGENWLATMQHIGREASAFVIGVAPTLEDEDIPSDLPSREYISPSKNEWLMPGNGIICSPLGEIVSGPMRQEKGFLKADIDLEDVRSARRSFDVVGHYSRPDIFKLEVDRRPRSPVKFIEPTQTDS
jgi:nitrilase